MRTARKSWQLRRRVGVPKTIWSVPTWLYHYEPLSTGRNSLIQKFSRRPKTSFFLPGASPGLSHVSDRESDSCETTIVVAGVGVGCAVVIGVFELDDDVIGVCSSYCFSDLWFGGRFCRFCCGGCLVLLLLLFVEGLLPGGSITSTSELSS